MKWPFIARLLFWGLTAGLTAGLTTGCSGDLPAASFIDKLRVLAVRAEPPEVAPGEATALDALVVEPPKQQLDGAPAVAPSYLWLACRLPAGTTQETPCGLSSDTDVSGPSFIPPPNCADDPSAPFCLIGTDAKARYVPDRSALGPKGTGQILLTMVVADTSDGAVGCLLQAANSNGDPQNPDHCVLSLKRLTVSDPTRTLSDGSTAPAPNRNPSLTGLTLRPPSDTDMLTPAEALDGGTYTVSPNENPRAWELEAMRSNDSAELEPTFDADGTLTGHAYESLSVSWFVTAGKLDGGRSAFDPIGCATQADCPDQPPATSVINGWTPPNQSDLQKFTELGAIDFYVVVRDDRGGVGWERGRADKTN